MQSSELTAAISNCCMCWCAFNEGADVLFIIIFFNFVIIYFVVSVPRKFDFFSLCIFLLNEIRNLSSANEGCQHPKVINFVTQLLHDEQQRVYSFPQQ